METVRKSPDGNVVIVKRPSGYAVSRRKTQWNAAHAGNVVGVQTLEWETVGRGLCRSSADDLFAQVAA